MAKEKEPSLENSNGKAQSPVTNRPIQIAAAGVLVWIAFLIGLILWKGTDIGSPTTESDALIRSNERLLQMAQWTITTVLTIGGALIGFNCFQNQRERASLHKALDAVTEMSHQIPISFQTLESKFHDRLVKVEGLALLS